MAPRAHVVCIRCRRGPAPVGHADDTAKLLGAFGRELQGAIRAIGTIFVLPQLQLRPLCPRSLPAALNAGRQEVEATVPSKFNELDHEPRFFPICAVEEIACGHFFDCRHRVRLPTASLPEHEHRAHAAVAHAPYQRLGSIIVDFIIVHIVREDAVKAELAVRDERRLQVGLEETVVQLHVSREWCPRHHRENVVIASAVLLLFEDGPLPHVDPHHCSRGGLLLRCSSGREDALTTLVNGHAEKLLVPRSERVLIEHLPTALLFALSRRRRLPSTH
mmetsp:Transcript_112604/g.318062  ORF Transcript_112604/g.318062 Transcript_112604/m.318062 type:complete len:276 (-) Transcript_112604:771-1598(-)